MNILMEWKEEEEEEWDTDDVRQWHSLTRIDDFLVWEIFCYIWPGQNNFAMTSDVD